MGSGKLPQPQCPLATTSLQFAAFNSSASMPLNSTDGIELISNSCSSVRSGPIAERLRLRSAGVLYNAGQRLTGSGSEPVIRAAPKLEPARSIRSDGDIPTIWAWPVT